MLFLIDSKVGYLLACILYLFVGYKFSVIACDGDNGCTSTQTPIGGDRISLRVLEASQNTNKPLQQSSLTAEVKENPRVRPEGQN